MKCLCTPKPIEWTPTKLPVNIQSNNEIKHSVACYRCIFIDHNIVYNTTNSVQNQFCPNKQEGIYYDSVTLSCDKKSFRIADVKKGFGKCFLNSSNIENKFLANIDSL